MSVGTVTLLICIALAFVLACVGIVRTARDGLRLKKRVEGYRQLPILALVATTEQRVARAQRSVEGVQVLVLRVESVFAEFAAAGARLSDSVRAALGTLRALPEILIDNLPAIFATRVRTPEN